MKFIKLITILSIVFSSCTTIKNGDYFEKIGNIKLNYSIRGKGPVLIVGHLNSGKIGYQMTLQPLEKFFTMVYYEPRGTGISEKPNTLEGYNQDFIVKELDDLRKHLKVNKIWIFGHSDQSSIALEYALRFPKYTSGLILSGTSFVGSQKESIKRRKLSETQRARKSKWFAKVLKDWDYMINNNTKYDKKGNNISDAPLKWWCYNEETSQKVIPIAKVISKQGRRKPINGEYYIESPQERNKLLRYQDFYKNIKVPTLIINGKYDTNNPQKYAQKLATILPNSTLIFIDNAGHFPWVENKEITFQKIENWLNKNLKSSITNLQ